MKINRMQSLLDMFQGNSFPAMHEDLAQHLGVSYDSVRRLAPGWVPIVTFKQGQNYQGWWAIPARDDRGEVIGIGLRSQKDAKAMYPGSKLGLMYEVNPDHELGERGYSPGPQNWARTMDAGVVCPVCGKPDGCLVSNDNVNDPKAVQCIRVPSEVKRGISWLHILKTEGNLSKNGPLLSSEFPVVVVEGFSDTATALDLGFVGVGRPSDQTGMSLLSSLLRGRDAWVIGENDKKPDGREPGKEGMIAAFQNLSRSCKNIKMVMPPSHVKDLRDWKRKDGINQSDLIAYMNQHGLSREDSPVVQDDRPMTVANSFLDSRYLQTGRYLLRHWNGVWYHYTEGKYVSLSHNEIIQPMYKWAEHTLIQEERANGEVKVVPMHMDNALASNLETAMMAKTLLPLASLPCWVNETPGPDPKDLIVFNNGILNVKEYLRGVAESDYFLPHTPDLFSTVALPFAFDPTAACPNWTDFCNSSLGDESAKVQLLQEWFGYCLTPDTSQQKMMYFRGLSGAGKGTALHVLQKLIGQGQGAATSFSELAGDFGLSPLVGKQICTIGDARTPSGKSMRGLELLLTLTGEDMVQVNRKNKDQLSDVMLIARITIASNSFIEVPDHEGAMARRLLLIEWTRSFADNADIHLREKLEQELPGIAIWALEGLRSLRQRGRFTTPESSVAAMADWRSGNSPLAAFIEECCEQRGRVSKARLFDVWDGWSTERRGPAVSRSRFYEQVKSQLQHVTSVVVDGNGGQPIPEFEGVSLKRWAEKKY